MSAATAAGEVFDRDRDVGAAAVDEALTRLERGAVWVTGAGADRAGRAGLKDMTSQLIGRFCQSALEATRSIFGPDPLTRYAADVVVPVETLTEIAVMKGIATTFVMTSYDRQPIYEEQREVLTELVTMLSSTGDQHLDPMFAADWHAADDDDARLRVVIDQVASLTDMSALAWHTRLSPLGRQRQRLW